MLDTLTHTMTDMMYQADKLSDTRCPTHNLSDMYQTGMRSGMSLSDNLLGNPTGRTTDMCHLIDKMSDMTILSHTLIDTISGTLDYMTSLSSLTKWMYPRKVLEESLKLRFQ